MFHFGQLGRAELEDVGDETHRCAGRIDVGAAGDVLLEDVVLGGPGDRRARDALRLGRRDVEGEKDRSRRVDGHRRRDLAERQAVEQDRHVGEARDRHADPADLSLGVGRVRVVAHLGREVERHREARLALLEQIAEPAVRLLGSREARVLTHRPEATPVHRRLDAAGERELAGSAQVAVLVEASRVGGGVEVSDDEARRSLESGLALGGSLESLGSKRFAPAFAGRIEGLAGRPVGSVRRSRVVAPAAAVGAQSRTRRRSPTSMVLPAPTARRETTPSRGARSSFCIFIASTTRMC